MIHYFDHAALGQAGLTVARVLLAWFLIIVVARALGSAFQLIGQPRVIGEMIAGMLLGPSLLGRVAPAVSACVFPSGVLPFLAAIAQIGVTLYMFLVGIRLDMKALKERLGTALAISLASIVAPFALGATLALWLYAQLSSRSVSISEFALFMGVAMSITAFPVLARILSDRQMETSRVGVTALACAAVGDVIAWCLLAFVVSVARARPGEALFTVLLTGGFIAFIFVVARPVIQWWAHRRARRSRASVGAILMSCVALIAAWITERIGIHALFGAFLFGLVVPEDSIVATEVRNGLEDPIARFVLPVFFAFTGLRTQIGLVHGLRSWLICVLIIATASVGKFGGGFAAARATGLTWREAASLGALMNTRGLMELIALNVGLDLGLISPALFTMLVLMAVVTTVGTTPILKFVSESFPEKAG